MKDFNKEFFKLFFLGSMGCGICGAFPNLAGMTTTMANIGIIYTSSPVIIIFLSILFFKEKINFFRILGLFICIAGVFTIISKGNLDFLINLNFTIGDLWVLGAALGWALYSIYLLNWKSKFSLMARFTLIAMFGFMSLFPFFILENIYFAKTNYNQTFLFWIVFAAISPSIIIGYDRNNYTIQALEHAGYKCIDSIDFLKKPEAYNNESKLTYIVSGLIK